MHIKTGENGKDELLVTFSKKESRELKNLAKKRGLSQEQAFLWMFKNWLKFHIDN